MLQLASCLEELIAEIEAKLAPYPSFRALAEIDAAEARGDFSCSADGRRRAELELDVAALPLGHAWGKALELREMIREHAERGSGSAAYLAVADAAFEAGSLRKSFAERVAAAMATASTASAA